MFTGLSGTAQSITYQSLTSADAGITGIEIVPVFSAPTTNVVVTADSTIDMAGTDVATLGSLTIGGQTLHVAGQGPGAVAPYAPQVRQCLPKRQSDLRRHHRRTRR